MSFFYKRSDPLKDTVTQILNQCDYGKNLNNVFTQCYNFLKQYPQFEISAEHFTYGGMSSGSKLAYLRGVMILNVDYEQHEVAIHFVLISGFPGVAPKAFLSQAVDEEIIKNNPYILKNMEILNQYINNWKGYHASYTLNSMYYYIYQSFLICPPVNSSITSAHNNVVERQQQQEETKKELPTRFDNQNQNFGQTQDDKEFQKILLVSKVEEKINTMNKIIMKLAGANITISQNSDLLTDQSEYVTTKKAIIESEKEHREKYNQKLAELEEDPEMLDEIIKPTDVISETVLDCLADEKACEDTMDLVRAQFRKKKLEITEYLDAVRTLSNQQFMSMAKRRKVISVVSAHNR